jgi:ankyrin repeat protein
MRQQTALGIAGTWGHTACVILLVEAGAEVNYKTKEVSSPLFSTSRGDQFVSLSWLPPHLISKLGQCACVHRMYSWTAVIK